MYCVTEALKTHWNVTGQRQIFILFKECEINSELKLIWIIAVWASQRVACVKNRKFIERSQWFVSLFWWTFHLVFRGNLFVTETRLSRLVTYTHTHTYTWCCAGVLGRVKKKCCKVWKLLKIKVFIVFFFSNWENGKYANKKSNQCLLWPPFDCKTRIAINSSMYTCWGQSCT